MWCRAVHVGSLTKFTVNRKECRSLILEISCWQCEVEKLTPIDIWSENSITVASGLMKGWDLKFLSAATGEPVSADCRFRYFSSFWVFILGHSATNQAADAWKLYKYAA